MRIFRQTMIVFGLLCLSTAIAWAQQDSGSMSGTVTDQSGAAVPSVTVTARNTATGLKTTAVTTDAGVFVFPSLQEIGRAHV